MKRDATSFLRVFAGRNACRGEIFEDFFGYFIGIIVLAVVVYFGLGLAVDFIAPRIPVSVEKEVFSSMGLEKQMSGGKEPNTSDPRLTRLQPMVTALAAQPETPKLDYRLFLVDEKSPNAFAIPGGGIGVTTGLMDVLSDDAALSFVLGHELGHFKNRDHLRGLGRGLAFQIVLSTILGDSDLIRWIGGNAVNLVEKKYSRKQEESADRFGLFLVYHTFGSTKGTTRLFEILQKSDSSPGWAYMFSTHPAAKERVEKMKVYAAELEKSGPPRNAASPAKPQKSSW